MNEQENIETVEAEIVKDDKFSQFKEKIQKGIKTGASEIKKGVKWCLDNKEDAALLGAAVLGGLKVIRSIKPEKTSKQRDFEERQLYYYDRRHDLYYELRRQLKTSEKIELEERIMRGESAGMILRSMRVLK